MTNKVNGVPQPSPSKISIYNPTTGKVAHVNDDGELAVTSNGASPSTGVEAVQTIVSVTPVKIEFPTDSDTVVIRHLSDDTIVWVGGSNTITSGGTDVFPLLPGDILEIELSSGNANELYAIVASGSTVVYTLGKV